MNNISIRPYVSDDKQHLLAIFETNTPLYFHEHEKELFSGFLERDDCFYDVIVVDNIPVGCGGFALDEEKGHVIFCWGMIEKSFHHKGLGTLLLKHRLVEIKKQYPNTPIQLGTTQHTYQFFEKFGFKTIDHQLDYWGPGLELYQMVYQPL